MKLESAQIRNFRTTTHVVNYKNCIIVIKNVPCEKCTQCGEEYFYNETVETLEKILDSVKTFSSTLTVTVIDYIDTAA